MICSDCGADTKVIDSRASTETIRRRRECMECAVRFSTVESRVGAVPKKEKPKLAEPVTKVTVVEQRPVKTSRWDSEDEDRIDISDSRIGNDYFRRGSEWE